MAERLSVPTIPQLAEAKAQIDKYIEKHNLLPHFDPDDKQNRQLSDMVNGINQNLHWLGWAGMLLAQSEHLYYSGSGVPLGGLVSVVPGEARGRFEEVLLMRYHSGDEEEQLGLMLSMHGDILFQGQVWHGNVCVPLDGESFVGIGPLARMN